MRSWSAYPVLAVLAAWLMVGGQLQGDVVTLKDGRRWEGTITSESDDTVVIDTIGGPIPLSRTEISTIHRGPTRKQEYEERRAALAPDDVDGHMALAHWCREQGLGREARYHFELVVGMDPDNAEAHEALGHQQVDGRWLTHDEAMAAQGLVRYGARWMEPAEAERARSEELRRELERSWRIRLDRLVLHLLRGRPEQRGQATADFLAIDDPVAAPAVVSLLDHRHPRVQALAMTLVEARGFPGGDEPLVKTALGSDDSDLRRLARLALLKTGGDGALTLLVNALASEKGTVRRRAALVLGEIGDPRAVPALIESVRETVVVGNTDAAPVVGRLGARDERIISDYDTVVAPGVAVMVPQIESISSAMGAGSPGRLVVKTLINHEAVDALETITGMEFGDDQQAWRRWWRQEGRSFVRGLLSNE